MKNSHGEELPAQMQCPMCKKVKPTELYISKDTGIVVSVCDECQALPSAHPEENITCGVCGKSKAPDMFSRDKTRKSGRYPRCKVCVNMIYAEKVGVCYRCGDPLKFGEKCHCRYPEEDEA